MAYGSAACTGPLAVTDPSAEPVPRSKAHTRPPPPNAPPPTNTVPSATAGDEMPAPTEAVQSSVPLARSIAYTFPSFEGARTRGPAIAGDAATEPAVG